MERTIAPPESPSQLEKSKKWFALSFSINHTERKKNNVSVKKHFNNLIKQPEEGMLTHLS